MNKKEKLAEMLENPYIRSFVDKHNLSSSSIILNFNPLLETYDSFNKCKNCKGLFTCPQAKAGEVVSLAYDGSLYNEITYCPFMLEKKKKEKEAEFFVRNDMSKDYDDLYLENIELPDTYAEQLCALCFSILDGKTNRGLYIYGNLGVGKTYMSMALANSLVKKGNKVAFIKSNFFVNEMRKLVAINNEEYDREINKIKKVKFLFIDDIGSESVSSYSRDDLLFNILDYRMENKLCTIFTSNLSKESLLKHYTYDKNDNSSIVRAKRLLERIDILSVDFVLNGENKRRNTI